MKRILTLAVAAVLALGLVGCGSTPASTPSATGGAAATTQQPQQIQDIISRGKLRAGVKVDVPKFGYKDPKTNQIDGFEIDMVRALAKKILGDPNKIELTSVNAKTRGPALDNGELDVVVATFTITEQRKQNWNFSDPYYQDADGLLVKKNSGIKSFKDLNGKKIGVAQGSTAKAAATAEAAKEGIKVDFLEFATYPEVKAALDAGRVDAYCIDGAILAGYVDDSSVLLPDRFSPQDYGVATKLDNKDLAKFVNDTLGEMKKNGEMDNLLKKWGLK